MTTTNNTRWYIGRQWLTTIAAPMRVSGVNVNIAAVYFCFMSPIAFLMKDSDHLSATATVYGCFPVFIPIFTSSDNCVPFNNITPSNTLVNHAFQIIATPYDKCFSIYVRVITIGVIYLWIITYIRHWYDIKTLHFTCSFSKTFYISSLWPRPPFTNMV